MVDLTQEQGDGVKNIIDWYGDSSRQEFYLAGFAGTGKTTLTNYAIEEIKAKYNISNVVSAAYTGKAAAVMRNKGVENAQTIHSLIYRPIGEDPVTKEVIFERKDHEASGAAAAQLIVLDECSMIGGQIADDLRAFKKKILVIGDPGQLPPIKPAPNGFTNRAPDVFLKTIHRQAADSPIIELATKVRNGEELPVRYENGDVRIVPLDYTSREAIFDPNAQVICGTNSSRWNYTQAIRQRLGYTSKMPIPGERIICCMNNYQHYFFNGYMGVLNATREAKEEKGYFFDVKLDDLENESRKILVDPYLFANHFAGGKIEKLKENADNYGVYSEFDWSYVITCHKAQGSGWENIVVIDDSDVFRDNKARWLYTAITRAEKGMTLLSRKYR